MEMPLSLCYIFVPGVDHEAPPNQSELPNEKHLSPLQMAEAVLFSLATDILKSLTTEIAKPVEKMQLLVCAKDQLQRLEGTVQSIRAVLLDAEKQQWQDNRVKLWLGRLKDVLYDVQDLLDDIATKDLRWKITPGDEMSKVVRNFFSKSNQVAYRLKAVNKIQELRKKLDRIKKDREFHLEEHQREETMVTRSGKKIEIPLPDEKIIGREEDKRKIKQFLFDSSSSQNVSFVAIVGKGGLGKTALARLVFNNWEVKEHFELKMWVCVSAVFDVNLIIKEILRSAKDDCQRRSDDEMKKILRDLENKPPKQLPGLLNETLRRKKYLLVLDDLWNDDRGKWLKLRKWLEGGAQESKILVTTRNEKVAKITDANSAIHYLHGLSEDKSWNLFRKMAFGDEVKSLDPELEKTGRDMAKKCAGVPLAIINIGRLFYGKEKDEWLRYNEHELPEIPEIDEDDDAISQVLKFSYDHLPSCLKDCFAYCSLFQKDYVYDKEEVIYLWMAQGFIESRDEMDTLEEVANDYLSELLCRSFLNATSKRDDGAVLTFKMHDLMHDLARKVAGDECKTFDIKGEDDDGRIRHVSFISKKSSKEKMVSWLKMSKWRTFIHLKGEFHMSIYDKVFSECRHCRVLVLVNTDIPLPSSSFGKLKHLRFLNISANRIIHSLPDSTTDLVNLQFLKLVACKDFDAFPRGMRKLVNLRYLEIGWCASLSHLPPLSELLSLRTLILHHLHELKFVQQASIAEQSNNTPSFFPSLERLSLHSCSNLDGWWGTRRRSDDSQSSFPKLRLVEILACPHLTFMPPFPQVVYLEIDCLKVLEQQLMADLKIPSEAARGSTFTPFSKLKRLHLSGGNLEPSVLETLLRLASNLKSMSLYYCDLRSLSCSMQYLASLQELDIHACDGLRLMGQEDEHGNQWQFLVELRALKISHQSDLVTLPEGIQHVTSLQSLEISNCRHLKSLPEWIRSFSLLEKLVLSDCASLMHLPFEMSNLTGLKELEILNCPALEERCSMDSQEDCPNIEHTSVIVWRMNCDEL